MRAILIVLSMVSAPCAAETLKGSATVIDGDTLEMGSRKIRLHGIDAPEAAQSCERDGQSWACGAESTAQLRALVGTAFIECSGSELDKHGRLLAVCSGPYGELNKLMVEHGWATAFRQYSDTYAADEIRARSSKRGLWGSTFVLPQEFRTAQAEAAQPRAVVVRPSTRTPIAPHVTGCLIKGNRNRRGEWIYHMPGAAYYEQTRAEEIFCTEAQARAAGYRRSKAG